MNYFQLKRNPISQPLLLFICFLMCATSCSLKQDTPTRENIEQIILALERQALDHWAQGNPGRFSENFANDATYFDDIAAQKRIEGSDEMKNYFESLDGLVPPHSYELIDPRIQVYDDIAILTLKYQSTSLEGEKDPPWKTTSVYRLMDGNWKVVHANWSLVNKQ
jgi:hypothetical protein